MMKVNLDVNQKEANSYLDEIKKHPDLAGYDVNLHNVNEFALYLSEKSNCLKCKGLDSCQNSNIGYITVPEDNTFVVKTCKYKKQAIKKLKEGQLIKTLFVSKSILDADLANFDCNSENRRKIYEYLIKFINNTKNNEFTKGLYIYGNFSTGKTYILGCLANELARNKIESLVIYFPDLVVELKNALGTPRYEELMNYLKSVEVLMLDDLGSENMTPWLRDDVLGPVLNYRLMEQKPIFISSNINFDTDELSNHLAINKASSDKLKAERIKSRLQGLVIPIELDNNSYRR